jgi:serine/threonine-protein kinase
MIEFRCLGAAALVDAHGRPVDELLSQPKLVALLAYLALANDGDFVSRDRLLAVFWPEADTERARNALNQSLHRIRSALGSEALESRGRHEVRLRQDLVRCDVTEFRGAIAGGDLDVAKATLRGPLLDGLHLSGAPAFEEWLAVERERLDRDYHRVLWDHSEAAEGRGDSDGALNSARLAVELRPFEESGVQRLMGLLDRLGDRAGALRAYDDFAERFREELGGEPSPETQELFERIRSRSEADPRGIGGALPGHPAGTPRLDAPPRSRGLRIGLAAAVVVLIGASVVGARAGARASDADVSIAVLTPDYLGDDEDGRYFAQGLRDEISARLAESGSIRTASRLSIDRFGDAPVAPSTLADSLGVRYLLESSVQALPEHLRVTVNLVDAGTEQSIWAETMEWRRTDVLQTRADVARAVASALEVELASGGTGASAVLARDPEAYQSYLLGRSLLHAGVAGSNLPELAPRAIETLQRATALDPEFAEAHAELVIGRSLAFWMGVDASSEALEQAEISLERAISLAPESPHTALAQAWFAYVTRQWSEAARYAERASPELRDNLRFLVLWGASLRRMGRLDEAVDAFEAQAAGYGYRAAVPTFDLVQIYSRLRRWPEAVRAIERHEAATGELFCQGRYHFMYAKDGDLEALDELLGECGPSAPPHLRFWHAVIARRYDEALAVVEPMKDEWVQQQFAPFPVEAWRAHVFWLQGDTVGLRTSSARHLPRQEALVQDLPHVSQRRQFLAMSYAGVGRHADAVREAYRALEIAEASRDQWAMIPEARRALIKVLLMVEDDQAALDQLENGRSAPIPRPGITRLRIDPEYDRIREDPRFQALLADAS